MDYIILKNKKQIKHPTTKEIKLLQEKVDPLGIRKLEVLAGKEREELFNKIIIIIKELSIEIRFSKSIS